MEASPKPGFRLRPRFSLRMLLMLTTCVALFCWWRQRPAVIADKFIDAVKARDYAAADALFQRPQTGFVEEFMRRDDRNRITVTREPQTAGDWLKGVCRMSVALEDFSGLGASIVIHFTSDATGVRNFGFHTTTSSSMQLTPAPQYRQRIELD
jgi:hypothetical protein